MFSKSRLQDDCPSKYVLTALQNISSYLLLLNLKNLKFHSRIKPLKNSLSDRRMFIYKINELKLYLCQGYVLFYLFPLFQFPISS